MKKPLALTLCAILVSLLAVSAAGQNVTMEPPLKTGPIGDGFTVHIGDDQYPDTLHDPSAAFDTLYWRFWRGEWPYTTDGGAPEGCIGMVGEGAEPHFCYREPRWLMREGRWDTLLTTRCDTVWVTVSEGQPEHSAYQRVQTRMIDCRDSVVVTPKPIRWDCPEVQSTKPNPYIYDTYVPPVSHPTWDSAG